MTRERYAVFDLGSTSFQLLVTEVEPDGSLTHVLRDRVVLNLGAEVAATGRVPEELLDRALVVVRRFADLATRTGADHVIPVATAAFREAANRPWLAKVLRGALGVPVRILAGDEEARCTVTGIRASVALAPSPWLAFDLGGGSLEVALVDGDVVHWTQSYPLGAARLSRTLIEHDPVVRWERREIRKLTREMLAPALEEVGEPPKVCVMAGGTAGALARLLAAGRWADPPASLNQLELPADELADLSRTLCSLPLEDRLDLPGIDQRRADLLPAGSIVLATALDVFGADRAVHAEWGLREGVVLREIGARLPASPVELRRSSIVRLVHRWGAEGDHVDAVTRHAMRLFDETAELHALGAQERELLGYASQVHDIGVRISPDKHHKHSAYLVEYAGLRGFTPDEIALMASIVRFHRGSGPKTSYGPYAALTSRERAACQVLAGILRIAHGLGRAGAADVVAIRAKLRRKELVIVAQGQNVEGALADAEERADVLARALGCRIRFEATAPAGAETNVGPAAGKG